MHGVYIKYLLIVVGCSSLLNSLVNAECEWILIDTTWECIDEGDLRFEGSSAEERALFTEFVGTTYPDPSYKTSTTYFTTSTLDTQRKVTDIFYHRKYKKHVIGGRLGDVIVSSPTTLTSSTTFVGHTSPFDATSTDWSNHNQVQKHKVRTTYPNKDGGTKDITTSTTPDATTYHAIESYLPLTTSTRLDPDLHEQHVEKKQMIRYEYKLRGYATTTTVSDTYDLSASSIDPEITTSTHTIEPEHMKVKVDHSKIIYRYPLNGKTSSNTNGVSSFFTTIPDTPVPTPALTIKTIPETPAPAATSPPPEPVRTNAPVPAVVVDPPTLAPSVTTATTKPPQERTTVPTSAPSVVVNVFPTTAPTAAVTIPDPTTIKPGSIGTTNNPTPAVTSKEPSTRFPTAVPPPTQPPSSDLRHAPTSFPTSSNYGNVTVSAAGIETDLEEAIFMFPVSGHTVGVFVSSATGASIFAAVLSSQLSSLGIKASSKMAAGVQASSASIALSSMLVKQLQVWGTLYTVEFVNAPITFYAYVDTLSYWNLQWTAPDTLIVQSDQCNFDAGDFFTNVFVGNTLLVVGLVLALLLVHVVILSRAQARWLAAEVTSPRKGRTSVTYSSLRMVQALPGSRSIWIFIPHVELLILLNCVIGVAQAQTLALREEGGCTWTKPLAMALAMLFPVCITLYCARLTFVHCLGDHSTFEYEKKRTHARARPQSVRHWWSRAWNNGHSILSIADQGGWTERGNIAGALDHPARALRIGTEPFFGDYKRSGIFFATLSICTTIAAGVLPALLINESQQLCGINFGVSIFTLLILLVYRPCQNMVVTMMGIILSMTDATSYALVYLAEKKASAMDAKPYYQAVMSMQSIVTLVLSIIIIVDAGILLILDLRRKAPRWSFCCKRDTSTDHDNMHSDFASHMYTRKQQQQQQEITIYGLLLANGISFAKVLFSGLKQFPHIPARYNSVLSSTSTRKLSSLSSSSFRGGSQKLEEGDWRVPSWGTKVRLVDVPVRHLSTGSLDPSFKIDPDSRAQVA